MGDSYGGLLVGDWAIDGLKKNPVPNTRALLGDLLMKEHTCWVSPSEAVLGL